MSSAASYDPYAMPADAIREPPVSLWDALKQIGPGIILAGSIVGSGELLLTTSLGAEHGFKFLWLIVFSCIIKVFVQIELGRYAISSGKPTLGALHEMPGPRFRTNWLVWWWLLMLLLTVSQLGAMVGGVAQALNLAFPGVAESIIRWVANAGQVPLAKWIEKHPENPWTFVIALAAVILLLSGGYKTIERFTTALVAGVTALTVLCVALLPSSGYPILWENIREGFAFSVPLAGLAAAFGAFGITGVGASELYSYPYWCLEKGYARYAGPRSDDEAWARRARGWIRVLKLDAWVSMVVFTLATVSFYLLGATVLHRQGLKPARETMIADLARMYVDTLGDRAQLIFLIGVWAVLFKTLYVASASHSRLTADFLSLAGFVRYPDGAARFRWIRGFCVFYPTLALLLYLIFGDPRSMVVFGGFAQGATLPIITGATLYLRYRRTDPRLAPSRLSDALVWFALLSTGAFAGFLIYERAIKPLWLALVGT